MKTNRGYTQAQRVASLFEIYRTTDGLITKEKKSFLEKLKISKKHKDIAPELIEASVIELEKIRELAENEQSRLDGVMRGTALEEYYLFMLTMAEIEGHTQELGRLWGISWNQGTDFMNHQMRLQWEEEPAMCSHAPIGFFQPNDKLAALDDQEKWDMVRLLGVHIKATKEYGDNEHVIRYKVTKLSEKTDKYLSPNNHEPCVLFEIVDTEENKTYNLLFAVESFDEAVDMFRMKYRRVISLLKPYF